jgi:mRNA interferase MazF
VPLPEPFRGEVWDVRFPHAGEHPGVVLSISPMNRRLGHVVVLPITGTEGPSQTHVAVDADAGLTRYDESYVDITGVQAVARGRLRRRRGLLAPSELDRVTDQLRVYLGM